MTINWRSTNTMVFSREPTECKVCRSWGCTSRASKGNSVPRGEVK